MSTIRTDQLDIITREKWLFGSFAALIIAMVFASIVLDNPLPLALPIVLLYIYFAVQHPKALFYLFFMLLPFSIEYEIGSLGTDLPSEPMMLSLMGIAFLLIITRVKQISHNIWLHPISLIMIVHICWIAITAISSTHPIISWKYFLAKLWYVIPFYFLPLILLKKTTDYLKIFTLMLPCLLIAIFYVLAKHAGSGFSFATSNTVVRPIFRNHVDYAIMLVIFLPYLFFLLKNSKGTKFWVHVLYLLIFLIAIYFSYTRAAQVSIILAVAFYFILRFRLLKIAIGTTMILAAALTMYLSVNNNYLDYAPDFERAVTHKKFDNLIEATTKMQDVSTVERFYRWIAGFYMVAEKPVAGFGPSTFFSNYRPYTVTSYKTYVSDNPEKSGIHNNYLMVAVEQGIPGLIIMLLMTVIPLLYAEQIYFNIDDIIDKGLLVAAATCHFLISMTLFMNDILEADKIGPLYFLSTSIIVFLSIKKR